jgi:hypothetical protein
MRKENFSGVLPFMYKISQNLSANFPAASFFIWPSFSYAAEQSAGWHHWIQQTA